MTTPSPAPVLSEELRHALHAWGSSVVWQHPTDDQPGMFTTRAGEAVPEAAYEELITRGYLQRSPSGRFVSHTQKAMIEYPREVGLGGLVEGVHPLAIQRAARDLAPILDDEGIVLEGLDKNSDSWVQEKAAERLLEVLVERGFRMPTADEDLTTL